MYMLQILNQIICQNILQTMINIKLITSNSLAVISKSIGNIYFKNIGRDEVVVKMRTNNEPWECYYNILENFELCEISKRIIKVVSNYDNMK